MSFPLVSQFWVAHWSDGSPLGEDSLIWSTDCFGVNGLIDDQ